MRSGVAVLGLILGVGVFLAACDDADEIELTGPVLEEVLAATQVEGNSGIRIGGTPVVRGAKAPLIFVDGLRMPEEEGKLGEILPEDIEKITVLKGARAVELYGDEGEAGVILISLKEGVEKKKQ